MSKSIPDRLHEAVATLNQAGKWATIHRLLPMIHNETGAKNHRHLVSQALNRLSNEGRLFRKQIPNPERATSARYTVYGYCLGIYQNDLD